MNHNESIIACTADLFCHVGHTGEEELKYERGNDACQANPATYDLSDGHPQSCRATRTRPHHRVIQRNNLVHLSDELVDVGFPVAEVSTLNVVLELACPPAASGVRELERPEEVARLHGLY